MRQDAKVYMSHTDYLVIQLAARIAGMSVSQFMRDASLSHARRVMADYQSRCAAGVGMVRVDGVLVGQTELPMGAVSDASN